MTASPDQLDREHVRAVARLVYRSIVRLIEAEAARAGLTHAQHPYEIDDLYISFRSVTHEQRVARLVQLGGRIDDLELPRPSA